MVDFYSEEDDDDIFYEDEILHKDHNIKLCNIRVG